MIMPTPATHAAALGDLHDFATLKRLGTRLIYVHGFPSLIESAYRISNVRTGLQNLPSSLEILQLEIRRYDEPHWKNWVISVETPFGERRDAQFLDLGPTLRKIITAKKSGRLRSLRQVVIWIAVNLGFRDPPPTCNKDVRELMDALAEVGVELLLLVGPESPVLTT